MLTCLGCKIYTILLEAQVCSYISFQFQFAKMITTGEGGVAVTNDKILYKKMLLYRSHGMERLNSRTKPYFYKIKI